MNDWKERGIDPADLTRFDPVPPEGIERALAIMRTGKLFRYSDSQPEDSEVALLERDFAEYLDVRHALAVNSCTTAIELALIACGVEPGSKVLVPGFTFTAVPSAIVILHATPVLLECTEDYRLDVDDLRRKITPETKILLLSHMRGHTSEMDAIAQLCAVHGITIIEDAAHALGGRWRGKQIGSFGKAGCFSFQSNKVINAGEGGMLTTNDDEIIVKATYLSGAYEMNYKKHFAQSPLFEEFADRLPLRNARMTNLTAAIARPQIGLLEEKGQRYRQMYAYLKLKLTATNRIEFPQEYLQETRIPDSVQFKVPGYDASQMQTFIERVRQSGLPLVGFVERHNARAFYNWRYLGDDMPDLPRTKKAIENSCDMRLPWRLHEAHLAYIVAAVRSALHHVDAMRRMAVI
jgi:dTDP-4-amino-4,6-dideoxygalactose transaminase